MRISLQLGESLVSVLCFIVLKITGNKLEVPPLHSFTPPHRPPDVSDFDSAQTDR